ncbi:MAG: TetR family transcriptional regulator C-terminal domain-containing protein [Clostridia bacterium]|nr:TetR family transcriptional regulator C-terminal domain-containing protein [Clostridia bacterium]
MQETRRVRMTKKCIKDAFIELLAVNPDKRLSITDICKCADINRSTFYMHYEDVNCLIKDIEDDVISQIPNVTGLEPISNDKEFVNILEKTFDYVKDNNNVFITLLARLDSNKFKKRLISSILEKYKNLPVNTDSILSKYGYLYCINGVIGLLKEWIEDNFPISSRDLAELTLRMSMGATNFNR